MYVSKNEYTFSRDDFVNGYKRACQEILKYIQKNFIPRENIQKITDQIREMIYWSEE